MAVLSALFAHNGAMIIERVTYKVIIYLRNQGK